MIFPAGHFATLQELKRFDEALASYNRALAVRPDYAETHWNESLVRLLTGDFTRGWEKYEWRWKAENLNQSQRNFERPLWLGEGGIEGKTIVAVLSRFFSLRLHLDSEGERHG